MRSGSTLSTTIGSNPDRPESVTRNEHYYRRAVHAILSGHLLIRSFGLRRCASEPASSDTHRQSSVWNGFLVFIDRLNGRWCARHDDILHHRWIEPNNCLEGIWRSI